MAVQPHLDPERLEAVIEACVREPWKPRVGDDITDPIDDHVARIWAMMVKLGLRVRNEDDAVTVTAAVRHAFMQGIQVGYSYREEIG